jgi:hypothetical protein
MHFKFRKVFKIGPVKLNVGKRGPNSITIGNPGAVLNVGKKGVKGTLSAVGTGAGVEQFFSWKRIQDLFK